MVSEAKQVCMGNEIGARYVGSKSLHVETEAKCQIVQMLTFSEENLEGLHIFKETKQDWPTGLHAEPFRLLGKAGSASQKGGARPP